MSDKPDKSKEETAQPEPTDNIVQTQHTITINGETIPYTVTTGTIILKEETQKDNKQEGETAKAAIFFIAYTRDDVSDTAVRPITFAFNGGPGAASVWLHMGVLGPKRVLLDEVGNPLLPPGQLVDNEYTLLTQTDLVFIDPVGTGYSRMVSGQKSNEYLSYQKDIESVASFIRLYTSRYKRWHSPKYLAGESYGTTRACGLAHHLQTRYGFYLNGLMLISVVLNFQTLDFAASNDLPYILYLPSYTATAWYHNQLDEELQADLTQAVAEAQQFALTDYTTALMQGNALAPEERTRIINEVARLTGLSPDYVDSTNLRLEIMRFTKALLRDKAQTVGRLDSRFTGMDKDSAGETFEFDPSMFNIMGAYAATFNQYIRADLGFESDLPYEVLSFATNGAWRYDTHENKYLDVSEQLSQALRINPYLRVFVANGYYDLATPFLATDYTMGHLSIDQERYNQIKTHYYEAGHMMYTHIPSLKKLHQDLEAFLNAI